MVNKRKLLKTEGKEHALYNISHFVSNIEIVVIFVVKMWS